jgi:hypothetical protein
LKQEDKKRNYGQKSQTVSKGRKNINIKKTERRKVEGKGKTK